MSRQFKFGQFMSG